MSESVEQLSCQEIVELVTDYVEQALPEAERARFDAHLEICEGCRSYVVQMEKTIRRVGRLDPQALSPEARQGLLTAFRNWKTS
jgi:anti-sigma factor RsiW